MGRTGRLVGLEGNVSAPPNDSIVANGVMVVLNIGGER